MPGVLWRIIMAVCGGAMLTLAFPLTLDLPGWAAPLGRALTAGTYPVEPGYYIHLPWLAFLGLLPLLENVRLSRAPGQAALLSYIAAAAWLTGHFSWISSFGWIWVVLLALFFALPYALFGYLAHFLIHSGKPGLAVWAVPALWTALEYLRSFGFWAFPWNLLGYSQAGNHALVQAAALGGVFAVSFLVVLVNCVLFVMLTPGWPGRAQTGHAYLGAGLVLLALAGGEARLASQAAGAPARQLKLALIQGSVSSLEEWNDNFMQRVLDAYLPLSQAAVEDWQPEARAWRQQQRRFIGPQRAPQLLVVWPESSLPRGVDPGRPERLPAQVRLLASSGQDTALLLGVLGRPHEDERAENGFLLVPRQGDLRWAYSKVRLVPYGEVVPLGAVARVLDYPWGDYDISAGRSLEPFDLNGTQLGLGICFDSFLGYPFREQVQRGAQVLILGTNNSWYESKGGIRQHCDMDVLRAVETGRMLARVSTTGWTHFISPEGITLASTNIDRPMKLERWVDLREDMTPYVRLGDLFAQVCLVLSALACGWCVLAGRSEGLL